MNDENPSPATEFIATTRQWRIFPRQTAAFAKQKKNFTKSHQFFLLICRRKRTEADIKLHSHTRERFNERKMNFSQYFNSHSPDGKILGFSLDWKIKFPLAHFPRFFLSWKTSIITEQQKSYNAIERFIRSRAVWRNCNDSRLAAEICEAEKRKRWNNRNRKCS